MIQSLRWKKIYLFGLLSAVGLAFLSLGAKQERSPDVPYVPTPGIVVEAMLSMAEVDEGDLLYDLGCGDGRIVITAAKTYGSRGVGIDIDPQRIKECNENARREDVLDKVEFFQRDLFETDFSKASVVTLYLLTEINRKLRPKLLEELRPGTRVVSHDFGMGTWQADKETLLEDDWEIHSIFLWIIPANVSGVWTWTLPTESGSTKYLLNLNQSFQDVSGWAFEGDESRSVTVSDGKINGDRLVFAIERKRGRSRGRLVFEGRVDGHIMKGTVKGEDLKESITWRAKRDPSTRVPLDTPIKDLYDISR